LNLKCTKFDFSGDPPQTPLGDLTALPRPIAGFKGPTSKGEEATGREGGRERTGEMEGNGRIKGGEGRHSLARPLA